MKKDAFINRTPRAQVFSFDELLEYEDHKVSSITLSSEKNVIITLFAIDKGEGIGGHASTGDAMVQILDGTAKITVGEDTFLVNSGETLIMPAGITHALYAQERFKMLLTVVKPG